MNKENISLTLLVIIGVAFIGFGISKPVEMKLPKIDVSSRPAENYTEQEQSLDPTKFNVKEINIEKGVIVVLAEEVDVESSNRVIKEIEEANMKHPTKPIYLLLNSPGGSVIDGARIISTIQSSASPIYTVCLQLCASMAAMILEYGTERYAVDRSIVMFHPASVGVMYNGELDKMVARFSFLKRYVDKMDHYVAQRSGYTYEAFKAKSSRELWVDAEDAFNGHYIDSVVRVHISAEDLIKYGSNKARQQLMDLSL